MIYTHSHLTLSPGEPPCLSTAPWSPTLDPTYPARDLHIPILRHSPTKPNSGSCTPHLSVQSKAPCHLDTSMDFLQTKQESVQVTCLWWVRVVGVQHQDWSCIKTTLCPPWLSHCWKIPWPWAPGVLQGFSGLQLQGPKVLGQEGCMGEHGASMMDGAHPRALLEA